ncbi:YchJ family metal-binding protein [Streptomyces sp. 549]|uniref:YchJ family protein n=1 Tax=Streptomyces sp. 549 TaxID=3049076 RepID=UPI0024C2DDC5|nr:YchJ family metal-binding protein [Streptomyces sp. 549]MDK1471956.1 YchJ family metal-binding protein [Streptomyces sp. 549]
MARRTPPPPRDVPTRRTPKPLDGCPCGLPAGYADCCCPLHRGEAAAPSPVRLMRSRYAAFAVRDEAYLLRSWHPATRPGHLGLDAGTRWTGLDVLAESGGTAFHQEGTVEFRAHFTEKGRAGALHERSRFVRHEGAWVYVDGEILP